MEDNEGEHPKQYHGCVLGATGFMGIQLVVELLESRKWVVNTVTRRTLVIPESLYVHQIEDEKNGTLNQHVVDFATISQQESVFKGNDVLFCLLSPSKSLLSEAKTDDEMRTVFSDMRHLSRKVFSTAQKAGIPFLSLLSCKGAFQYSGNLWLQNKGDVEEIAKRTGFDCISIFRPGATIKKDAEGLSGLLLNSVSNPLSVKAIVHAIRLEAGSTSFVVVM
ncbi:hypothetical protein WA588_002530 [Blastocystis sp. NMH]